MGVVCTNVVGNIGVDNLMKRFVLAIMLFVTIVFADMQTMVQDWSYSVRGSGCKCNKQDTVYITKYVEKSNKRDVDMKMYDRKFERTDKDRLDSIESKLDRIIKHFNIR